MSQIGVDLSCLPPTPKGFRYVVTAVDYFTKWVEARPLKSKTAEEVASFLFHDIVCRHGCVDIQIKDESSLIVLPTNCILCVGQVSEWRFNAVSATKAIFTARTPTREDGVFCVLYFLQLFIIFFNF